MRLFTALIYIYKIRFSQKIPHWLAKNSAKARPSIRGALSVSKMLLLGFIQAKKRGALPPTTSYLQR